MADFMLGAHPFGVDNPGPPLSEAQLAAFEATIAQPLPDQLRAYYLKWNGGQPYPEAAPEDKALFVPLHWPPGRPAAKFGDRTSFEGLFKVDADPWIDFATLWQARKQRVPAGYLGFAEAPGGSMFLIGTTVQNLGKVYFWSHHFQADLGEGETPGEDNIAFVADSFSDFLLALREEPGAKESTPDWLARVAGR